MSEWVEKRLGEIAPFKYGKPLREENRQIGKYNVYSSAGICGLSDDNLTTKGIIIGRKGTAGSLFYSPTPFFCIDTAFYIDETAGICDMKFIYYYMQLLNLGSYNNDAAVPGLNRNLAHKLKIFMPPLSIQTRIAEILSAYDDAIENNNRRIAILEKAAQELYREWFVRFRFPGYKKAKFVNGLPEGWEIRQIGEVVKVGRGSSPRPITDEKYFSNGNIPWIKIADATKSTKFILETNEYVNEYGASFSRKLPVGSMIIAASGTLGFPMFLGVEGCIHDGWMYFFDITEISKEYLYFALLSMGEYYNSISYGAAIQNINTEIIRKSKIVVPKSNIIKNFTEILINIDNEIKILLAKSQNLARQRDLLLPRLMSGKLEV